jgi:hypothetical protein
MQHLIYINECKPLVFTLGRYMNTREKYIVFHKGCQPIEGHPIHHQSDNCSCWNQYPVGTDRMYPLFQRLHLFNEYVAGSGWLHLQSFQPMIKR